MQMKSVQSSPAHSYFRSQGNLIIESHFASPPALFWYPGNTTSWGSPRHLCPEFNGLPTTLGQRGYVKFAAFFFFFFLVSLLIHIIPRVLLFQATYFVLGGEAHSNVHLQPLLQHEAQLMYS